MLYLCLPSWWLKMNIVRPPVQPVPTRLAYFGPVARNWLQWRADTSALAAHWISDCCLHCGDSRSGGGCALRVPFQFFFYPHVQNQIHPVSNVSLQNLLKYGNKWNTLLRPIRLSDKRKGKGIKYYYYFDFFKFYYYHYFFSLVCIFVFMLPLLHRLPPFSRLFATANYPLVFALL